jgi:hypothetical protein
MKHIISPGRQKHMILAKHSSNAPTAAAPTVAAPNRSDAPTVILSLSRDHHKDRRLLQPPGPPKPHSTAKPPYAEMVKSTAIFGEW